MLGGNGILLENHVIRHMPRHADFREGLSGCWMSRTAVLADPAKRQPAVAPDW
jgi:hypothetical protein